MGELIECLNLYKGFRLTKEEGPKRSEPKD